MLRPDNEVLNGCSFTLLSLASFRWNFASTLGTVGTYIHGNDLGQSSFPVFRVDPDSALYCTNVSLELAHLA